MRCRLGGGESVTGGWWLLRWLVRHRRYTSTYKTNKYNARSAYRSSVRGSDTEMQHLMKLLERDQYIHWHRLKDENVVRDIFWCHPDAVKLCNACNLVFLIDSTYKTNKYKFPLLDFVGVTPTGMTFFVDFAYLEGERVNNVVWALEWFRGFFLRHDALPGVIVTDRDLTLMNAMKIVFHECTNLLCRFHIDKNVKAKCKSLIGQKNAWEVESAHWALKKVLQNSLGDLCSVWDAMNNIITLQHTEIKASLETSTHVVGHVFKVTLYKGLLSMVSRYALNQIAAEYERVHYAGKNSSRCGCVMRTMHDLPCACELSKYILGSIPLDSIHMVWRRLIFSNQRLSEPQVTIKEKMETISKRFEELDVCGKVTLKSKLREIAYHNQNSMYPPPKKVNTKGAQKKPMNKNQRSTKCDPSYWEYVDVLHYVQNSNSSVKHSASSSNQPISRRIMPMLDQFHLFIHDFIDNIVDVKADDNCGYRAIAISSDYIKLFGGTYRFEELRRSLLVDGLSMV
ncbi:Protein FAR1-RELATED SEQUENCE 6 [Glycine soja]